MSAAPTLDSARERRLLRAHPLDPRPLVRERPLPGLPRGLRLHQRLAPRVLRGLGLLLRALPRDGGGLLLLGEATVLLLGRDDRLALLGRLVQERDPRVVVLNLERFELALQHLALLGTPVAAVGRARVRALLRRAAIARPLRRLRPPHRDPLLQGRAALLHGRLVHE